jgi:putative sigma-54 modulation protein
MYASIDAAAAALNRKLKKYKERRVQGYHGGQGISDDFMSAMDALDEYNMMESDAPAAAAEAKEDDEAMVDPGAPTVTKIKSYDLENAISLEEAIFSLDYVDHDFFVFKNAETDKVNVVYKRTAGGVGLIEV